MDSGLRDRAVVTFVTRTCMLNYCKRRHFSAVHSFAQGLIREYHVSEKKN